MEKLQVGLTGTATTEVSEANTAIAYGSGGVKVFATPAMIGLMEKAALSAVDPLLPEGMATVGTKVEVTHLAATPIGMQVRAQAELLEVEGKRLLFRVEAYDEAGLIGEGKHERYIIDIARFISRSEAKKDQKK
ncbi:MULTISPECIES: thioesterase family protein [Carboxydocella]|uniref:Predicted thioesterase n=2 Tax=Carboxydocella TaxID=178898 RepID=A0A1T4RKG2_9FIRM|nr:MULTISPECIES: thioesterase family protein [Carboxydocella]AVX19304.1 Thioesterase superfamily [Carboxydocella thermautotrophica]AVX29718.1 Thioesterase superfamily [Carboxydocella thermautotrophica]SKA16472.1 Predicted thioesterase [Carboxydocella sporoproducens DSM 16521]GAW27474.1 thioesterase [Carboxydocella sp. ULO1]GAW30373.1 thioesterase [Carboxydocella sp. JDF658]